MDEFYQRTLFIKKRFTFKDDGVNMELKDSDGDFSIFVHFDRIPSRDNVRTITIKKKRILRIGLLFAGLTFLRAVTSVNGSNGAALAG